MRSRRVFRKSALAPILLLVAFGLLDQVSAAPKTDLAISAFSLSKSSVENGESLTAKVSLSNKERHPATSISIAFWIVPRGQSLTSASSSRLTTSSLNTLPAESTSTVVTGLTVPVDTPAAEYQIVAKVQTSTPETTISNNTTSATLEVHSLPDASLTSSTSTSAPSYDTTSSLTASAWSTPCDYYASPTGLSTNSGLTQSVPIRPQDFLRNASRAKPGKTLCLRDGTYRGSAFMIQPTPGLSGLRGDPITIRALNDGGAVIDGQFARYPVLLSGNDWFVLEGFNAKSSLREVIVLNAGSANNIFRRVIAWDANIAWNVHTINVYGNSTHNLFEDVAAFGTGRNTISCAEGGTNCTFRRVWARWEGSINVGGKLVFQTSYNTTGVSCENCIATWSGESMPQEYALYNNGAPDGSGRTFANFTVQEPFAFFRSRGSSSTSLKCLNAEILGSLSYLKSTVRYGGAQAWHIPGRAGDLTGTIGCFHVRHSMSFIHPSHPRFNNIWGILLERGTTDLSAFNVTSVRGTKGDQLGGGSWNIGTGSSGWSTGTSRAAVASPWTTTGAGANLCKRWVNGQVTTEPLWPWPMNDRIKAATATAGRYTGPCPGCVGGRAIRTATDVTADIQALLGSIPAQCKQ